MEFTFYQQLDQMDCGPTCLRMIAKYYGHSFSLQTLREKAQINRDGVSLLGIAEAAESIGFWTMGAQLPFEMLANEVTLPCVVHWQQNHFVVVHAITGVSAYNQPGWLNRILGGRRTTHSGNEIDTEPLPYNESPADFEVGRETIRRGTVHRGTVHIADPAQGLMSYSAKEFCQNWLVDSPDGGPKGIVLLLEPTPAFFQQQDEKNSKLGLEQLRSNLIQYRKLIAQIMLGLLASSGIQLIYPLLTQSLVDIGVNTQNLSFVYLILIAMAFLLLSRQAIEAIRSWILLHISTRINLSILSGFLIKLMRLPNTSG